MTFKHKLSKRLALMRASSLGLAVLAFACTGDPSIVGPPRPNFESTFSQPGQVTDLKVAAVNHTSVSLSFTEVDDGAGQPAQYDVRYSVAPLTWWAAASVMQGSCATPVAGAAIGVLRTCTVQGLQPSTGYAFQLVAYRGTLNQGAVFGALSSVAAGTTVASGKPGTVLGLTVASSDTSATLSFAEVDDGTGQPAKYDIRAAVSPLTWWATPSVTRGTCATPLVGSTIGALRTCTVPGLRPSTKYDFQLVAYRGTLNQSAVFGGLSNVATVVTAAVTVAVAAVTLDPANASLVPGQTQQFAATVTDVSGTVLTGRTVSWASSAPSIASVDATGLVTALADGATTVTATSDGVTGSGAVSVASSLLPPPPDGLASECGSPKAGWIWCDDFEQNRLPSYFEFDNAGGNFSRVAGVGVDGSTGMRARFGTAGQTSAGALHLAFGKTPQAYFRPVDAGTAVYRDVYWRVYVKNQSGWVGGGGYKLSRATSFASSTSWAQAMIAHVWSSISPTANYLLLDPASGTDASGNLVTTQYNDFANLRWLGATQGVTPLFDANHVGQWYCVEAHAKLNDAGLSNGVFELWINGNLEVRQATLNWVGSFATYGINAVFLENYWNTGAPQPEERYFDNFVVATGPIGCVNSAPPPLPPPPPAAVTTVTVAPGTLSLETGQSGQLAATVTDQDGNTLADRVVTWSSTDSAVATISNSGVVTAVATGPATMIATCEGVTGSSAASVTLPPVASVVVSPGSASLTAGQTQQFTSTLKDASGNLLVGRDVTWTSTSPAVVTVSASGFATAVAAGSATITAASEGQSGAAAITVTAPVITNPGTVTDLAVAGVTDTSVSLSFTEVNDGTGQPAQYDVRVASSPLSWGSAPSVTRGTCTTPVAGTAIGARRTCTVLGLAASTTYGFQLVAFRGTLRLNAVFGGLSNVATSTTAAGSGVTDPPSGGGGTWPNQPVGFTPITERLFNAAVEDGWIASASLSIVSDATAPKSPSAVGQMDYPAGTTGGGAGSDPGYAEKYIAGLGYTRLYVSFWVKLSSDWQGNLTSVNKVAYVNVHDKPVVFPIVRGIGSGRLGTALGLQDIPVVIAEYLEPNLTDVEIVRGQWHRWEIVLVANSGDNADGELHWWIDGVKVGEYRNILYGTSAQGKIWQYLYWRPIWGGQGDVLAHAQYMRMDHFYASGR